MVRQHVPNRCEKGRRHFGAGARYRLRHTGRTGSKDHSLGAEVFGLLAKCEAAGALNPVVLSKPCIDRKVPNRFPEKGVRNIPQEVLLLNGKIEFVNAVGVVGRAGKAAPSWL